MRGVRLVTVVAMVGAFAAVGCAAGEDDEVEPSPPIASPRSSTPRKVFRAAEAKPPLGAKRWTTEDGSGLTVPSPIEEPLPAPPVPDEGFDGE